MNPPNHPTPRTDAAWSKTFQGELNQFWSGNAANQMRDECEKLERELTETERLRFGADADRRRLRAEVERWKTVAAQMSEQREHNANAAALSRAEVERLTTKIGNQADRIRYLEGATNHATGTPLSQAIARAEKAEAELADWSVLNLWGGTPEFVHEFVKGQQNRIHHCQDLEAELITERARLDYLDLQMGMPQVSEALNLPFSQCFPIRDAIDRAMKNETPIP
jgi:chromosome segregation ATPase